jgi:hypothetical protein
VRDEEISDDRRSRWMLLRRAVYSSFNSNDILEHFKFQEDVAKEEILFIKIHYVIIQIMKAITAVDYY